MTRQGRGSRWKKIWIALLGLLSLRAGIAFAMSATVTGAVAGPMAAQAFEARNATTTTVVAETTTTAAPTTTIAPQTTPTTSAAPTSTTTTTTTSTTTTVAPITSASPATTTTTSQLPTTSTAPTTSTELPTTTVATTTTTTTEAPSANLEATLEIDGSFEAGATVVLSLQNIDDIEAVNPQVTINYQGLELSNFVGNGWSCFDSSVTTVTCNLPPLRAGGSSSTSFTAQANGPQQISLSALPT